MRQLVSKTGAVLFLLALSTSAQIVRPLVIQKTEPQFAFAAKDSFLDPAVINLTVDEQGLPYSLETATSLPDNVVQTLSTWRFSPGIKNGKAAAFAISVVMPIRRPMEQARELMDRPTSTDPMHWRNAAASGLKLSPSGAAKLAQKLKDDESSWNTRASLLMFASRASGNEARDLQAEQVAWFVRHDPGFGLLGNPAAMIDAAPGSSQNSERYARIKELWLNRLAELPENAMALGHASYFFRLADPELAERLLIRAIPRLGAAAAWLGELYGLSALGVTALDPAKGVPVDAKAALPSEGFGAKSRSLLRSSNDPRIVLNALSTVSGGACSLARGGKLPSGFADFCQELLAHAKVLYPGTQDTCDGSAGRADEMIQRARLTKQPIPIYPPDAKFRRVGGSARFRAVIGTDGKLSFLEFLGGPLAFYESSRRAVSGWEYQPAQIDNQPVEVSTQIEVNYTMKSFR